MEGMGATDTAELHIRGDFRRAAEFVFPLLKMAGKVTIYTCIILLLCIYIYVQDIPSSVGESHFRETHAARRLTSATRVKTDLLIQNR